MRACVGACVRACVLACVRAVCGPATVAHWIEGGVVDVMS